MPALIVVRERPVAAAVTCMGRCFDAGSPRERCSQSCTMAGASSEVVDTLAACVQTCHAEKATPATDRSTCDLNCGQVAKAAAAPATAP